MVVCEALLRYDEVDPSGDTQIAAKTPRVSQAHSGYLSYEDVKQEKTTRRLSLFEW